MRLRNFASALACGLLIAAHSTTWCADPDDDDSERPTVKQLIDQLANKNQPPPLDKESAKGHPIWPNDYDWGEHERIRDAWKELHGRAEDDLGELFNHLGDHRYCVTMASPSGAYNHWTVGDICYHILRVNIEPFQLPGDKRFDAFMPYLTNRDGVKKLQQWWRERRDKSLMDLQLESIEHTLDVTKDRVERAEDDRERKRFRDNVAHLEKLKGKIEQSGGAIKVDANRLGIHVPTKQRQVRIEPANER